jgi:hypothetical protein
VDVGREAAARRDDVKAGLMTLADFFGEQGLDWKTAMQEIAAERQFAAELGVVVGVERTEGATVIDPVPTSPDLAPEGFSQLDCGTGRGGFKPGNACAKGGGAGSKKKTEGKSSHPAPHRLQVITDFEERVKSQDFESILILDGSGNVLVQKDGDERSVDFDFGALDQADGVVDGKIQIPGLVASHLPVELVGEFVNGRIKVGMGAFGEQIAALDMNTAFGPLAKLFLLHVVYRQQHTDVDHLVKMPRDAVELAGHIAAQGGGDLQVVTTDRQVHEELLVVGGGHKSRRGPSPGVGEALLQPSCAANGRLASAAGKQVGFALKRCSEPGGRCHNARCRLNRRPSMESSPSR